jgi:transcriptional regulator with XRE-family HTH domain
MMNKPKPFKPNPDSLSQYVQRICRQKNLSIRDIQERAGGKEQIAASYISRIINGKVTNLSVDKLVILAEGLDVDPFELFAAASGRQASNARGGIDALVLIDIIQQTVANPDSLEVLEGWLRFPPEHRSAVLNLIRILSQKSKPNDQSQKQKKR